MSNIIEKLNKEIKILYRTCPRGGRRHPDCKYCRWAEVMVEAKYEIEKGKNL